MEKADIFVVYCILISGCVCTGANGANNIPKIQFNGTERVVDSNHDMTLTCLGVEPITWTYPNETISGNQFWSNVTVSVSQSPKEKYKHRAMLTMINASYVDTGYYYCHGINADFEDPYRSSKIYVFVRDKEHLSVLNEVNDGIQFISAPQYSTAILPCRPTSPDVRVTLFDINEEEISKDEASFNRHIGFVVKTRTFERHYNCRFERDGKEEEISIIVAVFKKTVTIAKPYIYAPNNGKTSVNSTLLLNCSISVDIDIFYVLNWIVPDTSGFKTGRIKATNATYITIGNSKKGWSTLTINNVQSSDQGQYTCVVKDHSNTSNQIEKYITVLAVGKSHINLSETSGMNKISVMAGASFARWVIKIDAYPNVTLSWLNNRGDEVGYTTKNSKYSMTRSTETSATLMVLQITLNDSGVYQLFARNNIEEKVLNLTLIVQDKPAVHIEGQDYYKYGVVSIVQCKAAGYPLPSVEWLFKPCIDHTCSFKAIPKRMYTIQRIGLQTVATLNMVANMTGSLKCIANNILGNDTHETGFFVTDVESGFDVWGIDENSPVAMGDNITLHCAVSVYNYTNKLDWYIHKNTTNQLLTTTNRYTIEKNSTEYTHRATIKIKSVSHNETANYACYAHLKEGKSEEFRELSIKVKDPMIPKIYKSNMNGTEKQIKIGEGVSFNCYANGIPAPKIIWRKDNHEWAIKSNQTYVTLSEDNTMLTFSRTEDDDAGEYSCRAENRVGADKKSMHLKILSGKSAMSVTLISIIVSLVIFLLLVLLALITVLFVKYKKEKKLRREMRIAGLNNFEKGALESLNPELGVDDQAELLPYDKKWEFPRDKLKLGKQLGSGAFGVVLKAEAFGLLEDETVTIVAVKMVKRNADYTYIKALASELKIMVHLGKHLNVVNLLGACTKNVAKRELLVMVEYCRFGNLHNYLLRHRDDFVNQIDLKTGSIDITIGAEFLSRTMSVGSNQSGSRSPAFAGVDYRSTPNPSSCATDSTTVCTPTGEDTMVLSNNSVQPEWRSNYRGDYKGNVKPISTHDLLCWAFQVARGMEYLASRKVLHGDLAARNILLAEDNIVKICDFGLAKSMYKSDNYKKKGDGPLPVKWMAVESIRDRVFSTQSDVWSYGIVLWEFFSLARTPYPGMDADERLYSKLVDGYRMDRPEFSTKEIYQIMTDCWHAKPISRPSFTNLAENLGHMLQESVRQHYIELNDPYITMNNQRLEGHSDYLAMLSSPDYGNLSSPTHHYVNDLPPEDAPPEASGYLAMDIFSPKNSTVFDFELHKKQKSNGEPASGIELLPMLHVTNESDSESPTSPTKSFANPTYQTAPIVDSTKDSEPKKDNIVSTCDNYINMPQQKNGLKNNYDCFSNPSYIQMDNKNIINDENDKSNYVNSNSRDWERPC